MSEMLRFIRALLRRSRRRVTGTLRKGDAPPLVPDGEERADRFMASRTGRERAEAPALPGVSCDDYA
jgi:hypothetical protein